ncbi:MAG TPA: iron ABC transporter permease [Paracoccus solventivorans]|uniref:FecCD family ABC transporter permease n=1 Tax=Paracoccus solventivorans TaxID=53463 RepID=UPI002CE367C0|nr:iron ABC transporter permease [Paracoccus solventivorans]HMM09633.1 iron ABC transporter permease [Paracoccus solventivorans]
MSRASLLLSLAALVAVLALASLLIGPAGAGPVASLKALWGGEGPLGIVLREIRAPRAVLGVMLGVSLGLSGAALQGYLRNPLAEPGLIGISAAAALGAVIAIQAGVSTLGLGVPAAGLTGALGGVGLILLLAGRGGSGLGLILGGIAVSALAGALTALVLNLSPNPFAAYDIMFWTMGSLADRSWGHVLTALPLMGLGWAVLLWAGRDLDALSLGEEAAASMGVDLAALRLKVVLGAAAAVGAATAVAGAVGFVGLVVPHLLRGAVGAMPSRLLPAAALGGAALVLTADIAVRLIMPERDLKLGVMMALVGAPVFLHLIWRTQVGK